ncbi:TetR/AcrR family transcriptional regulator [Gemmobacter serpentinus]|uniref:TetR/AcrR family transcriptional regulator n=1 Tax=Gemmobacter serpentinus TaxID=2652247 RepID=UPI00124EEBE1|nr:TetR/AcrR family transcriptional regulator [Gemmobacter serpentinus]
MPIPAQPKDSARDRLLRAAAALFYDHGINGTGIDAVIERAGVARKSLYNNFSSKADLIAQYIEARHAEWLALYATRRDQAKGPKQGILAVFDAYQDHAEAAYEHGFRGCGLLNAAAELEVGTEGRAAVRRHKEEVEAIVTAHLAALIADDPARLAQMAAHLTFLLEGAMVRAGLEGDSTRLEAARKIVTDMLDPL